MIIETLKRIYLYIYSWNIFFILLQSKDKTFLFDDELFKKLDQAKIDVTEKMNYFDEALCVQKEDEKKNILYKDSIELWNKKPSFPFLVGIFVKIYNTELYSKLLDIFNKKVGKLVEGDNKEILLKYKIYSDKIVENSQDFISKFNLNEVDFYGLIIFYLNICNKEKFKRVVK